MNWPLKRIGDFCTTGSGGTPSRSKGSLYYGGDIPWVKSGELEENVINSTEEMITKKALVESSAKYIPSGASLVAMYGATVGRVAKLGIRATSNQAVCHIIPDETQADRDYTYYALQAQTSYWLNESIGGAQPNISQKIIRNTLIPVPPSLEEQQRIVARIKECLGKVDEVEAISESSLADAAKVYGSAIRELFIDHKDKYPGHALEDLSEIKGGGTLPKGEAIDNGAGS